jgi:protein-S-isoprenylcysteine O-methyltransferase Ste14
MWLSILALVAAFVIWALLHSVLAAMFSKDWARRTLGPAADRWYRLAYNVFALLTLLPVLALYALLPDQILYAVPVPWSWLLWAGQFLALLGLGLAFLQTGPLQFLGLSQVAGQPSAVGGELVVLGFYCRVRHPLYFFGILLIWLTPTMTVNWLTVCVLATLYFYLGALHEEQRLLGEFGQAYVEYRRRVPMLFPRPGRCVPPGRRLSSPGPRAGSHG